jgi:chorismate dehydratase
VPTRISASSYLNTAPLVWSFLYGQNHGRVEIILDNAPARSAELLSQGRVNAALVPIFAYQSIEDIFLIPDVCVGAHSRVQSVCLITKGSELNEVKSVALDSSSRTSVALTKVIFREFLCREPEWKVADPEPASMLANADGALIIGDPALRVSTAGFRVFDLAALWREFTGLGFIFAMWMCGRESPMIDFAAARDEGIAHIDEIIANYPSEIGLSRDEMKTYLTKNISYSIDDAMREGMELYFKLTLKHELIEQNKPLRFVRGSSAE